MACLHGSICRPSFGHLPRSYWNLSDFNALVILYWPFRELWGVGEMQIQTFWQKMRFPPQKGFARAGVENTLYIPGIYQVYIAPSVSPLYIPAIYQVCIAPPPIHLLYSRYIPGIYSPLCTLYPPLNSPWQSRTWNQAKYAKSPTYSNNAKIWGISSGLMGA